MYFQLVRKQKDKREECGKQLQRSRCTETWYVHVQLTVQFKSLASASTALKLRHAYFKTNICSRKKPKSLKFQLFDIAIGIVKFGIVSV